MRGFVLLAAVMAGAVCTPLEIFEQKARRMHEWFVISAMDEREPELEVRKRIEDLIDDLNTSYSVLRDGDVTGELNTVRLAAIAEIRAALNAHLLFRANHRLWGRLFRYQARQISDAELLRRLKLEAMEMQHTDPALIAGIDAELESASHDLPL